MLTANRSIKTKEEKKMYKEVFGLLVALLMFAGISSAFSGGYVLNDTSPKEWSVKINVSTTTGGNWSVVNSVGNWSIDCNNDGTFDVKNMSIAASDYTTCNYTTQNNYTINMIFMNGTLGTTSNTTLVTIGYLINASIPSSWTMTYDQNGGRNSYEPVTDSETFMTAGCVKFTHSTGMVHEICGVTTAAHMDARTYSLVYCDELDKTGMLDTTWTNMKADLGLSDSDIKYMTFPQDQDGDTIFKCSETCDACTALSSSEATETGDNVWEVTTGYSTFYSGLQGGVPIPTNGGGGRVVTSKTLTILGSDSSDSETEGWLDIGLTKYQIALVVMTVVSIFVPAIVMNPIGLLVYLALLLISVAQWLGW